MRFSIPSRGYVSPDYPTAQMAAVCAGYMVGAEVHYIDDGEAGAGFRSPRDMVHPVAPKPLPSMNYGDNGWESEDYANDDE